MSSSLLSNIPVPSLTRMEVASTSRRSTASLRASGGSPTNDIALEDIKKHDGIAFAAEAQEDPRASVSREAGERDPLALRGKIVDETQLNELRQCVQLEMVLRGRLGADLRLTHRRKKSGKITQFYEDQNDVR